MNSSLWVLKGQAKQALLEMMREVCRHCDKINEEISSTVCNDCEWRRKELLIRSFLE